MSTVFAFYMENTKKSKKNLYNSPYKVVEYKLV